MKSYLDNNILAIIKKKPFYLPLILTHAIKGLYKRKSRTFRKFYLDELIIDNIQKLTNLNFSIEHKDDIFWKKNFLISNSNLKWDLNRNILLEKLLLTLINSQEVPTNPSDKEDYWSATQLNWLFFKVRQGDVQIEYAKSIIEGTCSLIKNDNKGWLGRPFTHSELFSNIVKISLFYGNSLILSKEVKRFLEESILFILNNLEIYSESDKVSLNHTNNHLLANVRALFWATRVFDDIVLQESAEYVFKTNCMPLFDNGTLNEGSTIYHFIAAQCIFDISFFLPTEELPRVDKLILKLEENGFIEPIYFPIIGDVSPDPILGTVIEDALNISKKIYRKAHQENLNANDLEDISNFEFYKYKNWDWILHSRNTDDHIQHSHNDYGSPVLNYKNQNIIFDVGRPTYKKEIGSDDFTITEFHSVPQIAGLDQNPRGARDIYPNKFITPYLDPSNKYSESNSKFNNKSYRLLCSKTYQLFPNFLFGGLWHRFFISNLLDDKEIIIEDIILLDCQKYVEFRFFIPQSVTKDSIASFEFILNGKMHKPNLNKVKYNNTYGQINNANYFEIFSKPDNKHHLSSKVMIIYE